MQDTDNSTQPESDEIRTQTNADRPRSTGRRPFLRGVGATIAAAGGLGTAGVAAADPSNTLEAVGDGFYSFSTSGEIVNGGRANLSKEDDIDGQSASGEVANDGTDSYHFAGELTELDADDGVTIYVNGEEIGSSSDGSSYLEAVGDGFYSFTASGDITNGGRANTDKEDVIDGQSANGEVANDGTDSYNFEGELTALDADDGVTITVDGDEVDPSEFDTDAGRGDTDDDEEEEEETGDNEYETIVVDAGETYDEIVGSGETLENVLYDVTADGASLNIDASGDDWAIRNIGIEGELENASNRDLFTFEVTDDDGTGVVENLYAGGGTSDINFVFVRKAHEGEVTIRNVNFQGWKQGIYASAPGIDAGGGDGPVYVENCYAKNNGVANYRLGSDGSYLQNSVAHVDDYTSHSGYTRGLWVRNGGDIEATGLDILIDYDEAAWGVVENDNLETGGVIHLEDSSVESRGGRGAIDGTVETANVDDDPDLSIPDGVPQSAEEAASR
ncbi:hypothetical protein [Haloprofundus halobius]|uniref:hypothetical protein n=1 Tax=Haloprofundus halobius TaxID=2876194 RepID=UPI001CCBF77D|nr:hypothetical protein [Haloprofundus halobius]